MANLQQAIDIKKIFSLLKRKDIAILIVIILLLLILLADTAHKKKKTMLQLGQNLTQEDEKLGLLKEIKALDKKIKKSSIAFKEFNVTNLINKITEVADRLGLSLKSIDPLPNRQDNRFIASPLSITLRGNYHGLGEFVSAIENFKEFIEIREIRLNLMQETKEEGTVGLDITISLECFSWS